MQLLMHRYAIFQAAQAITPNIIMFLPRNVDLLQVEELCWLSSPPLQVEVWSCPYKFFFCYAWKLSIVF